MKRYHTFAACISGLLLTGSAGLAQSRAIQSNAPEPQRNARSADAQADRPTFRSTAEQRNWLKQQLPQAVKDRRQLQQYRAQIDRLTPQQIDVMTNMILAQQLPQNDQQAVQQARLELERAIILRQMLERELYWRRMGGGAVGYRPVVTWLPQGTSLSARAVVSPDGRYVRVSPSPFFSSIGPVYNYNLNTGATRLQRPYPGYPYGYSNGYRPQGYQGYTNSPGFGQMPPQHLPPSSNNRSSRPRRLV